MIGNQKDNKKVFMEFLRIIAAFFVISNHVNNPIYYYKEITTSWYASIGLFFASKIAVPLFLMISGGLLLSRNDSKKKHLMRVFRLCSVLTLYTILYYIVFVPVNEMSVYHFVKHLLYSVTNAYWYIYLYLGILILMPVLQKLAAALSKKELQLLLVVSIGLGGFFPMLQLFTGLEIKNEFLEVIFSPYLGLLFAGYYIEKYLEINKKKVLLALGTFVVLIVCQVLVTAEYYKVDNLNYMLLDNRIFITITTSAICIYIITKYIFTYCKIPGFLCKVITYVGGLTFGIYLLSDLIINLSLPIYWDKYYGVNPFIGLLLFAFYVFIICGIFTAILKRIPFIKKLL